MYGAAPFLHRPSTVVGRDSLPSRGSTVTPRWSGIDRDGAPGGVPAAGLSGVVSEERRPARAGGAFGGQWAEERREGAWEGGGFVSSRERATGDDGAWDDGAREAEATATATATLRAARDRRSRSHRGSSSSHASGDAFSLSASLARGMGALSVESSDADLISSFAGRHSTHKAAREKRSSRSRDPDQRRYGKLPDVPAAAATGDPGAVAFMATWGHHMDEMNKDGRAGLHVAAENGDAAVARELLSRGAAPSVVGTFGLTPAHVAAYCGHVDVLELILAAPGADTNARDQDGSTPLHWAVSSGKVATVEAILARDDVDIYVQNEKGRTAAEVSERDDITSALAAAHAAMDLHVLADQGRLPIIRRALNAIPGEAERSAAVHARDAAGETMIHRAAREGRADVVEALCWNYGADPDAVSLGTDAATPLHLAAEGGHVEVLNVFCFLGGGEDALRRRVNARKGKGGNGASGSTPAHLAAMHGHLAALETLVDRMFADVDAKDDERSTPLHVASVHGHVDVVESLIQRGADVGALDGYGCHAIHLAAEQGHEKVVRRLLRHGGADILARNAQGNMALHLAAAMGHLDMLIGLMPRGDRAAELEDLEASSNLENVAGALVADAAKEGKEGEYPYDDDATNAILAARRRRRDREQKARRRRREREPGKSTGGFGVNVEGFRGWTCLHYAAHGCYLEMVEHLLRIPGLDPSPVDITGATPLHLAAEGGSTAVIEALLAAPGVDPILRTDAGFTPLHIAAMAGHVAATRMLVRHEREREEAVRARAAEAVAEAAAAARLRKENPDVAARAAAAAAAAEEEEESNPVGDYLNLPAASSYTALHLAAMRKHDRVVRLLLSEGARAAVVGDDGNSPLHLSAAGGADEVCRSLLRAVRAPAAMINERNVVGETATLLAANNGRFSTVQLLMDAGANPLIPDDDDNTCLHGACRAGDRRMFLRIMRVAARDNVGDDAIHRPNAALERPLHLAAKNGAVDMVRCLVDRGADVSVGDQLGHNALMVAAEANSVAAAAFLISHVKENGAEPAKNTNVARRHWRTLRRAVPDIAAAVTRFGVNPAAPDGAAEEAMARIAARREGLGFSGGDGTVGAGDNTGETSLLDFLAVAQEAYKRRQRDRYVNHTSAITGYAALHLAAERGLTESVRLLLDSGANPDLPDSRRANCALHMAAREGKRDTVHLLVERGASLNTINEVWYTSLHLAARYGSLDILDALLDAADAQGITAEVIDVPRKDGATPLHSAVESSYEGVVDALLARGAFWNAKTIRNESVLHVAARAGHPGIVRRILEHRRSAIAALRDKHENHGASDGSGCDAESDGEGEDELEDDPVQARDHTESMPLHWAADGGHLEAVKMIVEAGAPLNMGGMWRGSTAVHLAARNGHADVVRYLHARGANVNAQDMWNYATPLILAAEGGHLEVIQFLLDRRVRIGVEDKFGTTAAQNARTAEVRQLIRSTHIIRNTVLAIHGATRADMFLGWRDIVLDGKAERARDSKGTWQMVFALYGENRTAMYYWLWRQWEMRGRRRRRALGDDVHRVVEAMVDNPGFAGMSRKRVAELAESMFTVEYAAGQTIVVEGEPGDAFFVIVDGRADVLMTVEDDDGRTREVKVTSLGPGKSFGEVALRFRCPRTATVRSVSDCVLLKLWCGTFLDALAAEREDMEEAAALGDRPRTLLDPDDPALMTFSLLPRPLQHWEREMLATLFTVERFDQGTSLPVPTADNTHDGDGDDAYLGLVLSGVIKTTRRDFSLAVPAFKTAFLGPGEHYAASAVLHPDGGGVVERTGAVTCSVALDAEEPAVVALLQGVDIKELPRTLAELLMGASLPASWDPPPRRTAISSAAAAAPARKSEARAVELARLSTANRSGSTTARSSHVARGRGGATSWDERNGEGGLREDAPGGDEGEEEEDEIDTHGMCDELIQELTEAFKFVDTDDGGEIDANELKFAARALGFEPNPKELKAMLDAIDEDGGGTVDLGEFIGKITERLVEVTSEDALDAAFDCFDIEHKGAIVLEDVARAAKIVGDNVTSEELEQLMNLGAADLNDDGEIDREEFALIMDNAEMTLDKRQNALREELKRQAKSAEEAHIVAQLLSEYRTSEGGRDGAGEGGMRQTLRDIFADIAGPEKSPDEDEIDVRDLILALRKDSLGDGSLAKMLNLPNRIRAGDGSRDRFEVVFREIDKDGSGTIDLEEFVDYFIGLAKERAREIVNAALTAYEEDDEEETD